MGNKNQRLTRESKGSAGDHKHIGEARSTAATTIRTGDRSMSWCMARCNTLYLCSCIILVGAIVLSNRVGQSLSLQRISILSWKRSPSAWNRQKNSWFQKRIMLTKIAALSESAPVTATIQLQLEQSLTIDSFITHFRRDSRAIEGVFLLENADGIAVIANFSVDVCRSVAQLQSDFQNHNLSSVRVQTFLPFQKELALEYLKQLVRMTNPFLNHSENCELTNVVKSEVEESTKEDLLHNNPPSENAAKFMPLEKSSQNEREPNVWELSLVNVDLVLNEIRPYLQSDGGNIAVVSVDTNTRSIQLQLQGACGSCPSSTVCGMFPIFVRLFLCFCWIMKIYVLRVCR